MLVPDGVTHPTRVLLHIHGFRGVCDDNTLSSMLSSFGFLDLMKRAEAMNSVIIIPRSEGHETTFNNELSPRFNAFVKWVNQELNASSLEWTITGHSGAYQPIGSILNQENSLNIKIKNIVMLDATYSQRASYYNEWIPAAAANPEMHVYSVTRPGTANGTAMLKAALSPYGISVENQTDLSSHCGIPKKDLGAILDQMIKIL